MPRRNALYAAMILAAIVVIIIAAVGADLVLPLPRQSTPTGITTISSFRPNSSSISSSASSPAPESTSVSHPVEVIVVTGPIPPYNPKNPTISISLMNVADAPIISLNATLVWVAQTNVPGVVGASYSFVFGVNSSSPLLPSQTIQLTSTFVGPVFEANLHYPLTIDGTLKNGTRFSYVESVLFVRAAL